MACTTERRHKGSTRKWATRMCTGHPCGHNLANLIWPPSNEMTRPDPNTFGQAPSNKMTRWATNKGTREKMENRPHERAQGTRVVTT